MTIASLQINTGYSTYPIELRDRYIVTKTIDVPGRPWPRKLGYHQWHINDQASVHLDAPLLWTLIEVRIVEALSPDLYSCIITRFDGSLTQLAGLSIGDELRVENQHFFAHWAPGQTREEGEGAQKVYEEGSTRRPMPIPGSERTH